MPDADDWKSNHHSKLAEMDASPDVQEKSQNLTNQSISEPASPTPQTKSSSARWENCGVKSKISMKSSDKDTVIDQLKEWVIALACMSFFFFLKIRNLKIHLDSHCFVRYRHYQAFSHLVGMEIPHKTIRGKGVCSLELSRRCPISLRWHQRQRYTRGPC